MSKRTNSRRQERHLKVRGIRREHVDLRKLSRALLELAQAEAEREAQAEQAQRDNTAASSPKSPGKGRRHG